MQRDLLRRSLVRSLRLEPLEDRHLMAALTDDAYEQNDMLATAKNLGEIASTRTIANLGQDLTRPDVFPTLGSSPKEAADQVVDIVLAGLRSLPRGTR